MKYEDQWKQDTWKKPKLRNDVQLKNDYVIEPLYFYSFKEKAEVPFMLNSDLVPFLLQ